MRSSVAPCVLPTGHRPNGRKVVCFRFSCTKSLFCILCLSGVFKLTTSAQFPTSEAESRAALLRGTPQTSRDRKMGRFLLISLKTWQHLAVLKSTHPHPWAAGHTFGQSQLLCQAEMVFPIPAACREGTWGFFSRRCLLGAVNPLPGFTSKGAVRR